MPNPLIPWPGGKRRLLQHLYPHFPAHECYVEAFAGGAAALLHVSIGLWAFALPPLVSLAGQALARPYPG